jgi:hypothetical protein
MRWRTYARRYTVREVLLWQALGWFGCSNWSRHPFWKAS